MAVNEILLSFSDNLKKARNPFFGTFIVVWVIRNWQLLVTLFNLSLFPKLEQKIFALQSYFADDNLLKSFAINSVVTLLVLVITYLLLNISRLIINFFEKQITPRVYQITDKTSIVLKSELDAMQKKVDQLESRLAEERSRRVQAESERDQLETKRSKTKESDKPASKSSVDFGKDQLIELSTYLKNRNLIDAFIQLAKEIRAVKSLNYNNQNVRLFGEMGLILYDSNYPSDRSGHQFYKLTQKGDSLYSFLQN